jgi:hypothetical protein
MKLLGFSYPVATAVPGREVLKASEGSVERLGGANGQGRFGTRLGIDFREPPIADSLNLSMLPDASGR